MSLGVLGMRQPKRVSHQPATLQRLGSRGSKSRMVTTRDNHAKSNVIPRLQVAEAARSQSA
jgi:hypothetical protein